MKPHISSVTVPSQTSPDPLLHRAFGHTHLSESLVFVCCGVGSGGAKRMVTSTAGLAAAGLCLVSGEPARLTIGIREVPLRFR